MQEFGDKAGWRRGCEFGSSRRHQKNAESNQLCAMQWDLLSPPTMIEVFPGCHMKYTTTAFTLYLLQAELFLTREMKEAKTLHKALCYLTKTGRCSWDRWQIDRATLASSPCFSSKYSWASGPWCKCSSPPQGWTPAWLVWYQHGQSCLEEWRLSF